MDSIYDGPALERFRRRHRLDPHALRRFRNTFLKRIGTPEEAAAELSPEVAAAVIRELRFHHLQVVARHDSDQDGATRLILRTDQDRRIEAVILRIATGRTTLCVSSQVGCAAACTFCATGRMGLRANLRAAEIVDQLAIANALLKGEDRRIRNIVFMGMGEPLHNEEEVFAALALLTASESFAHADSRILVSTVGVPGAMVRLAERFPRVRLAVSLHAARAEVRARIVPMEGRHPLGELRAAIARAAALQASARAGSGPAVMLEFVMLRGVNDAPEDADAIVAFSRGLPVHINLIPYNAIDGAALEGTDRPGQRAFAQRLKDAGLKVTVRYSLGQDIAAACGQLVRREEQRSNDA